MSTTKKKELTLQETFYNLCKDLIRYIDRKIVKKYIFPNQAQVPKEKRIKDKDKEIKYDNNWRYFYEDEETSEEDKIKDIFKDNTFLLNLQKLYNSLYIIVINMEENKKNIENLNKKLEIESQKLKLYGEINYEISKYLIENNISINNMTQNDFFKVSEYLQRKNIFNNVNKDMIQPLIKNNINNNDNNIISNQNVKIK